MANAFIRLLKRFQASTKKRKKAGFTLIELLITMIISSIIITVLLSFVVDLVQTDRQEYARSETQRDMQAALDFMVADLREAVYVYDSFDEQRLGSAGPLRGFLPNFGSNVTPVLAFWKVERLPYADSSNASLPTCAPNDAACNSVLIRGRSYSLVVYLLAPKDPSNPRWKGEARIVRYVLRQYNNLPALTITPGYVDPQGRNGTSFATWPVGAPSNGQPTSSLSNTQVLVDFVDKPTNRTDHQNRPLIIPNDTCNSPDPNNPTYTPPGQPTTYRRIPPDPQQNSSFFVCVKTLNVAAGGNQQEIANQDIIINLRGNPIGKVGDRKEPLITLTTQAVARGLVDKKPQ